MTNRLLSPTYLRGRFKFTKIWTCVLAGWFIFALTGAAELRAQVSSGTLVGSILDASSAGVPNAKVDVKNRGTAVVSSTVAGPDGSYRVNNLIAGSYDVTASASGMTTATVQAVAIAANSVVTQNVALMVGSVSTTVDVISAAAVIDTTTASIQNSFDTNLSRDLPVSAFGLGPYNLSLLGAGVASNGGIGAGQGPSVGGQRPYNNNFMIEGVDANNKAETGSLLQTLPNDAVAEFEVLQNQVTAEYGHSSGGQFNVILKSGTNAFHGTGYEYFWNRNLDAIDQVVQNQAIETNQRPSNPRYDNNRFGGSLGGPIKKDKLFFFVDYEYNPIGYAASPAAVSAPTAQGMSLLSGIPGLSATNLGVFKKYSPVAAVADPAESIVVSGVTIPVGNLQFNSPSYANFQTLVLTSDYDISDQDRLRGRYITNRESYIDSAANLPAFYTTNGYTSYLASLAEYHNFSAVLNNEFRLGYNRFDNTRAEGHFSFPGLDSFPNLIFYDLGIQMGPDPQAPQSTVQNTYQLQDNLTWVKGKHTFQFGFDGRRIISPQTFTQYTRGDYEYLNLQTFLQDAVPDYVAQRGLGNATYSGDQFATYEYAQDTWKVRKNLTLSLGLRYELTTPTAGEKTQILNAISDAPGVITFGVPQSQKTNFAPRVGLAYSPGSKGTTSIRAGFGMAYDVLYDNVFFNNLPPQVSTYVNCAFSTPCPSSNFLAQGGISPNAPTCTTVAECRADTHGYIPNQELPYSIQWNIGVQHVFANNYTLEVRYLGTRGVHLDLQQSINLQPVVTPTNYLPTYLAMPSQAALNALPLTLNTLINEAYYNNGDVVPRFNNAGFNGSVLTEDSPTGWSTYNGLAVQLNRRFAKGMQFQGAYTWSHLIDNSTADFDTTALTPRRPQDSQNLATEKATSALDRRQRLTLTAYFEAPWYKHSNWFLKNLVGNWTAAPIYTYESPELVTPQSAVDSNLNGDAASDRVIVNPNGTPGTGSGVTPLVNSAGDTVAYLANNPKAQYIQAQYGALANSGRNTLPGRPIDNVDLSLYKNFNLTERVRLQFGATFYNLFNHAQFVPGLTDGIQGVVNNSAAIVNYLTPGNPNFNNPEAVYSSNPRSIQLGLKLIF